MGEGEPSKSTLRKQLKRRLANLAPQDVADWTAQSQRWIVGLDKWRTARSIFIYVSYGNEVGTHELIRDLLAQGRSVVVPLIMGEGIMEARRINSFDDLVPGRYGIFEPQVSQALESMPDLCIAPGMAFTRHGDRLGSGGGFYDRYLSQHAKLTVVGLCYDLQLVDQLPRQEHDQKLDLLVTESGVIHCAP